MDQAGPTKAPTKKSATGSWAKEDLIKIKLLKGRLKKMRRPFALVLQIKFQRKLQFKSNVPPHIINTKVPIRR